MVLYGLLWGMYGLVWSCMVLNGWSCVVLYSPLWSCMVWFADVPYVLLQACMYNILVLSSMGTYSFTVIYSYILCGPQLSYMVYHGPMWSCTVLHGHVCSGMFIYVFVLSYIVQYGIV